MVTGAQRQQAAAAAQRTAQGHLLALALADFTQLWGYLEANLAQLGTAMPAFLAAASGVVAQWGRVAGVLAADYYTAEREAAGVAGSFTPVPAAPPPAAQVEASLQWATRSLWGPSAPSTSAAAPAAAPVTGPVAEAAAARILAGGVMGYLVLAPARDTITDAVAADGEATGWARYALPGCCSFCAMLASRGPVYKSEAAAGFTAHDHERCFPVPMYKGQPYEEPPYVTGWRDLWATSTAGLHGRQARNAFRVALAAAGEG